MRSHSRLTPVFSHRHSPYLLYSKFERTEVLNRRNFANKLQTVFFFRIFAVGKWESWIAREKHHERPATNNIIKNFRSKKELWKKNP